MSGCDDAGECVDVKVLAADLERGFAAAHLLNLAARTSDEELHRAVELLLPLGPVALSSLLMAQAMMNLDMAEACAKYGGADIDRLLELAGVRGARAVLRLVADEAD